MKESARAPSETICVHCDEGKGGEDQQIKMGEKIGITNAREGESDSNEEGERVHEL